VARSSSIGLDFLWRQGELGHSVSGENQPAHNKPQLKPWS